MQNVTLFERLFRRWKPAKKKVQAYQTGGRLEGTVQILDLLTTNISQTACTVLDVGCNEGVFARALAERGYFVLGMEGQQGYVEIGQKAISSNGTSRFQLLCHKLAPDEISKLEPCDVVMLLSVHHQLVSSMGLEVANRMLLDLAAKARQQFFFAPACIQAKYGAGFSVFADNDYPAIHKYFRDLLEIPGQRRLRFLGDTSNLCPPSEPLRPIFVLEPEVNPPAGARIARDGEAIAGRSDVFEVSTAYCRLGVTQSPHASGWSYLSATAAEIHQKSVTRYEDSILRVYYEKWQPRNWAEIMFPGQEKAKSLLGKLPTRVYSAPLPWASKFTLLADKRAEFSFALNPVPDSEFHSHGPMEASHGEREFERTKAVYHQLQTDRYLPELNADGYVRGYFLRKGTEVRFLVTGGQHRVGVLGALGVDSFRAKFQPSIPRCIDLAEIGQWPAARAGLYSLQEAEEIFNQVFIEDGTRIAAFLK